MNNKSQYKYEYKLFIIIIHTKNITSKSNKIKIIPIIKNWSENETCLYFWTSTPHSNKVKDLVEVYEVKWNM